MSMYDSQAQNSCKINKSILSITLALLLLQTDSNTYTESVLISTPAYHTWFPDRWGFNYLASITYCTASLYLEDSLSLLKRM